MSYNIFKAGSKTNGIKESENSGFTKIDTERT